MSANPTLSPVIRFGALVLSSFLLLACGADGPDENGDVSSTRPAPTSSSAIAGGAASGTDGGTVEPNGEVVDVVALDNTFRPETVEIVAGTEVRWENRGRNEHDVVPVDDSAAWGVDVAGFAPGDEYTTLFDTPGEYPYYCTLHGTPDVGMIGTVVVLAVDG